MTKVGGSKKQKTNPTKGKPRILPGKLNEQRNLIRQKKCTTQKFVQASTSAYQPRVAPPIATPTHIEAPTKTTVPTKASAPTKPVASDKTLAPAQIVGPTPSPIHSSTPEVFRFMPTPGLGLESMVNNSQHASREASANEDVQQTYHDVDDDDNDNEDEDEDEEAEVEEEEVVVGQANVPQERKDDKGRIIIQPIGKGLVPAYHVSKAIGYAIRKQFYKPIHSWSQLAHDSEYPEVKAIWFERFGESFKKKLSTVQAQIDETTGDGVQEVDGGTKLRLWSESAGGRTRGRVYGTADLSVNLRRGCTSFTQKSQDHHGSMYEMSLEAERAARVRAEEKAAIAEKKADEALAQSQVAIDLNKQLMIQMVEFKKFIMERDRRSGNGSCSATQPPSHPHYDDNLDDQSLHSDS